MDKLFGDIERSINSLDTKIETRVELAINSGNVGKAKKDIAQYRSQLDTKLDKDIAEVEKLLKSLPAGTDAEKEAITEANAKYEALNASFRSIDARLNKSLKQLDDIPVEQKEALDLDKLSGQFDAKLDKFFEDLDVAMEDFKVAGSQYVKDEILKELRGTLESDAAKKIRTLMHTLKTIAKTDANAEVLDDIEKKFNKFQKVSEKTEKFILDKTFGSLITPKEYEAAEQKKAAKGKQKVATLEGEEGIQGEGLLEDTHTKDKMKPKNKTTKKAKELFERSMQIAERGDPVLAISVLTSIPQDEYEMVDWIAVYNYVRQYLDS